MQDVKQLAIELYFIYNCTQGGTGLSYSKCLEYARFQIEAHDYKQAA